MGTWESVAVTASCIVAVIAFIDSWARHKKDDRSEVAAAARRIENRLTRLEIDQFGTNHGGMREQLNKVDSKVESLDGKVDRLATGLAELHGALRAAQ